MDADGELFRKAMSAIPDMIKPNIDELKAYEGIDGQISEEKTEKLAKQFIHQGIELAVVSMGKDGAMFLWDGNTVKCPSLVVKAHSTVGAGDAMVAAMAYAWENKLDKEEMIRLCMAASAGAVTTIGTKPPAKELVERLITEVSFVSYK